MLKKTALLSAMFLGLLGSGVARAADEAATLKAGDAAPALQVGKFVKGEPVSKFEDGKLYVVEFWATWCGPCKVSIPHLSEMQQKNPDVTFIGVDAFERDDSLVEPFVQEMGDKMNYRVALDDKSTDKTGAMATTWMKASKQPGIPTAFIVGKDSKIAWIGHPMVMEDVLAQVKAGTFDSAKWAADEAKREAEAHAKAQAQREEMMKKYEAEHPGGTALMDKFAAAAKANDFDAMRAVQKDFVAVDADRAEDLNMNITLMAIRAGKTDIANASAKAVLADKHGSDAGLQNFLMQNLQTMKGADNETWAICLGIAEKRAEKKTPTALDTLAMLHARMGHWDKATEIGQQAIDASKSEEQTTKFKGHLESYKKQEVPAK